MSLEGNFFNSSPEPKKESSSKRLMLAMESLGKLQVDKISIEGSEHLKEIPKDRKVIIVTTHITDLDMPLAATAVGNDLDIAVANMSVHHSFKGEAPTYLGLLAAGKSNFFPIDFEKNKEVDKETGEKYKGAGAFNPDNFTPMAEAMKNGKRILIAGHNPSHDGKLGSPGYGAAYLAEIANAMILPVGVNLKPKESGTGMYGSEVKTFLKKPDADIKIGAPFELSKIEGINEFSQLMKKRETLAKTGERLSDEEMTRFFELSKQLRKCSEEIFAKISMLVPESRQRETESK